MMRRFALVGLVIAGLGACAAQPTPYQPRVDSTGYSQQQIDGRTWRVQFAGNSVTPRETVENYLLYRAAEIMRFGGYDKFVVLEKEIERDVRYHGFGHSPGLFLGHGLYRDRFFFSQTYAPYDYYPTSRYTGHALIRTYAGGAVPENAVVYDADELIQQLGPTIQVPQRAEG